MIMIESVYDKRYGLTTDKHPVGAPVPRTLKLHNVEDFVKPFSVFLHKSPDACDIDDEDILTTQIAFTDPVAVSCEKRLSDHIIR